MTVIEVEELVLTLLGWPTDVFHVHHPSAAGSITSHQLPKTLLLFVPGNPGCAGWYNSTLVGLVERLGPSVAAYGISYAGHSPHPSHTNSTTNNRSLRVAWTIDGQVDHKIAFWDDHIEPKYKTQKQKLPKIIWLSHSIGSHMVQRLLVKRSDLLQCTQGVIHFMPFVRMQALPRDQQILDFAAARPRTIIAIAQGLLRIGRLGFLSAAKNLPILMQDPQDRKLAIALLQQHSFVQNFFQLGLEEIRDVGETIDISALQYISQKCPMAMLYAANDQWGPRFHVNDLQNAIAPGGVLANTTHTIQVTYHPELRHDYVSYNRMKSIVVDWCHVQIEELSMIPSTANNMAETSYSSIDSRRVGYGRSKL